MITSENINILIIDDNALVLSTYESVLVRQGYCVLTAKDGKSALEIINQNKISLILLDVILPDLSGLEILRIIKSDLQTEHIFVVLISSLATTSESQIEGMELGADGYLVKPMPVWELVLRVNGFIKHMRTIERLKISEERYRKISEKTRKDLKESNAYLCAILENNSNIFVAMDKNCLIQFANRQAIEMSRVIYGKELTLGRSLLEIVSEDQVVQFKKDVNSAMNGKPVNIEWLYVQNDGTPIWFGIQYSRSTDSLDNDLGVFIVVTDITKRKGSEALILMYQLELEQMVKERTSELVRSNEGLQKEINERKYAELELQKLSNVVEQAADHVLITDENGVIEYVNPAFEAGTGYSKEEAIGLNPRILKSENNNPYFAKELWNTVLSKQTFRGVTINKKKNGTLYYEAITVTPLLDANNNNCYLIQKTMIWSCLMLICRS